MTIPIPLPLTQLAPPSQGQSLGLLPCTQSSISPPYPNLMQHLTQCKTSCRMHGSPTMREAHCEDERWKRMGELGVGGECDSNAKEEPSSHIGKRSATNHSVRAQARVHEHVRVPPCVTKRCPTTAEGFFPQHSNDQKSTITLGVRKCNHIVPGAPHPQR